MHPILLRIGPITLHTYGFLIAIGFLAAMNIIKKLSIHAKLPTEKILDLTFWILLVGFLGARIVYVFTRFDVFLEDPISVFKIWEGGLVFFGGPILAVPFAIWYLNKNKIPIYKAMDAMVPGLVIGHAFGRMGCLAAGCCYGKPTTLPWGVKLHSELVDLNLRDIPLHPTQIYESMSMFVLFAGLVFLHRNKRFDGQVILTYFLIYPIIRSIIEIYRGDLIRGFIVPDYVSTSQFISAFVFLTALVLLFKRLSSIKKLQS